MPNEPIFISKEHIDKILNSRATQGKHLLRPLASMAAHTGCPLKIIELDHHTNVPEVHTHLDDLWCGIEGEVKFTVGGAMINPRIRVAPDGSRDESEERAERIEGGKEIIVKSGDWLWIPAGTPHQHMTEGTARLFIIKIPHS